MYNGYSSPTLINCKFTGHSGARFGGGMFNEFSNTTLIGCAFIDNSGGFGSAIDDQHSHTSIVNCLFVGNDTSQSGAIHVTGGHMEVVNCTFAANRREGPSRGRALTCGLFPRGYPSNVSIRNSILWDGGDEVLNDGDSVITISYSDVADGWTGPGEGNVNLDPLFATEYDNLRLTTGSPCLDAGDPAYVPRPGETDLDGHARVLCGRVDMGAYESGIGDVDCNGTVDLSDFADWAMCMTGPAGGSYTEGCESFDFEFDGDVDLNDYSRFLSVFRGPQLSLTWLGCRATPLSTDTCKTAAGH
jgi:hypothetical protein